MKNLLTVLVRDKMEKEGLSLRDSAKQSGVSHNTIRNILIGVPIDFSTLEAVCKWLGISPIDLMESSGTDTGAISAKIATIMKCYPQFESVFNRVMDKLICGDVEPEIIRDLLAYINYRLGTDHNNEKDGE